MVILLAWTTVDGEQPPSLPTAPYATLAVVLDWSVAKLIATWSPTRSVRYGARVRCESKDACGRAVTDDDCAEALPAPSRALTE